MSQAITAEGTQVFLGPSVDDPGGDYILIGELASMEPVGREWDVNDVTNFQSNVHKEKIKGLLNPGQFNLIGNRIFDDASQAALKVAFEDPRPYWFRVVFPVNPYTGAGEIWTFAALVLSIDPPMIAPDKALKFYSKLQVTGARHTSTGYSNATGEVTKHRSVTLGGYTMVVTWSDFSLSPLIRLPADAEIVGIYPSIIASANYDIAFQSLIFGPNAAPGVSGKGFGHPFDTGPIAPGASFASTQFWGADVGSDSIGTSLADLTDQVIFMAINSSLLNGSITDRMSATGVGYAVYYTSSNPKIDILMPPPFAVPAGQGLAWALPFSVAVFAEAGQGNTGTATGTAATPNG